MTRILLIETASPKRVFEKAEQVLKSGTGPSPEITILCREKTSRFFRPLPAVKVRAYAGPIGYREFKNLARERFDIAFAFWTGENRHGRWKLLPLLLRPNETRIVAGDGNEFRLTWKAICRHAIFRFRHPLPTDHYSYRPPGERVLIIQSAEPAYVRRALDRLKENALFIDPRLSIFCRNRPDVIAGFQGDPMLKEILPHSEARDSWSHWRALRRQRFDAIVLFLTGDPSYWKVKIFAFLLGTRRILIFNETNDCFFFNFRRWLGLMAHRFHAGLGSETGSRWAHSARLLVSLVLKSVALPFRFVWLLLVWTRLRMAGLRRSIEP